MISRFYRIDIIFSWFIILKVEVFNLFKSDIIYILNIVFYIF